ncbi:MAG TPA: COP23 domain-containing protein [Allocoleopsis sp.]
MPRTLTQLPSIAFRQLGWTASVLSIVGGSLLAMPAQANTAHSPRSFSVAQFNGITSSPPAPITTTPNSSSSSPTNPATISTPPSDARFSCEVLGGDYTVVYHPQSQPGQTFAWAKPMALGGGWSVDRRCAEISRRLESYRPDGLVEMRTSTENGYNIICVTTEANPSCRIVLTVPPGQDPIVTRDRVFENLTVADSGEQTQAINTFAGDDGNILNQIGNAIGIDLSSVTHGRRAANSSEAIDLRPFLDPADGGTGERL